MNSGQTKEDLTRTFKRPQVLENRERLNRFGPVTGRGQSSYMGWPCGHSG